jgi:hypothetical protein
MDIFTKTALDTKTIEEFVDMYAPERYCNGDWTTEMAQERWKPLGPTQCLRKLDAMAAAGIFTKLSGILPGGKHGNLYRPVVK